MSAVWGSELTTLITIHPATAGPKQVRGVSLPLGTSPPQQIGLWPLILGYAQGPCLGPYSH